MQDRIQQLESLVVDLMQKTSASRPIEKPIAVTEQTCQVLATEHAAAAVSNEDIAEAGSPSSDAGSMQFGQSGVGYVNSAHWAAVLDGIADIREHFENEKEGEIQDGSQPSGTVQP
ncbi:hypothetical protein QQZ08_005020 [Neonectria magnoliae]|uniref:Uncharacterized protein n=1 Tax=Neonectria magnoliae TaxID=2732573 RepID=A0ABR1I6G4_9HYPO